MAYWRRLLRYKREVFDLEMDVLRYLRDHPWIFSSTLHEALQDLWEVRGRRGLCSWVGSWFSQKAAKVLRFPGGSGFYVSLVGLERQKLIMSDWENGPYPRQRAYCITERGRQFIERRTVTK